MIRRVNSFLERFRHDTQGAVLTEALIVVPFIVFFASGILEFGSIFWEKQIIETGLRDAARFVARCQSAETFNAACRDKANDGTVAGKTVAARIAFYGTADEDATALRWCRWRPVAAPDGACGTAKALLAAPITFEIVDRSMVVNGTTVSQKVVTARTNYQHQVMSFLAPAWPIFGWAGLETITVQAFHEERYLGW
ncbi:TadE/TadG family type IV pilus assembly protein [Rhizobium sullae]|uniref:TadE-like protein n=1 Tax=Rhizobium sullae TaxID=50338 RepID=A0A4R3Q178_RHISU|nr:TadE/TadG family type IV pilus assembly protein [Rhizobium sullae]TCU14790.1 TadE-like protein [Rhizobium sullae]